MQLDSLDREILVRLQQDGRTTHAAMGRELGVTGPAVYARVRRMEEAGIIRGYRVDIDPSAIGGMLLAYVRVTTRPQLNENDAFEEFVQNEHHVLECHDVDGEDSYVLKVRCASPAALRELLIRIRALPAVLRTVSTIALVTMKDIEFEVQR